MPFLPSKRHTISSAGDVGLNRRPQANGSPSNSPYPTPPRRAQNLYSARGAHFSFDDRPSPSRQLHQDKQTYDALVGNGVRPPAPGLAGQPMLPPPQRNETKSPAQLYEDQYRPRPSSMFREKPARQAPVVVYLRTNVIVKDEYSLVTDMSQHFSVRYTKPQSAIMITVDHSTCLLLGATFEPAYVLTITAVPSELHPDFNRLNVAYIQSFMASILGVSPDRGIIRFEAVQEENLGINGTTVASVVDRGQRAQKLRHSIGGYGMPPDVARTFIQQSPRGSFSSRPRTTLEPVADAEPNNDDSTMRATQDKQWHPVEDIIPTNGRPHALDVLRESQPSPSPAQRQTPSPPPTLTEKSPLRNPLASNPPAHRTSSSQSPPNATTTTTKSTDWRPAMPNAIAERLSLNSSPDPNYQPTSDPNHDRPERRGAKLVKRQSVSRPRPLSSYTTHTTESSATPPSIMTADSNALRPLSYGSTDAIPPSVPSRLSPVKKQSRRMSGLFHAFRRH